MFTGIVTAVGRVTRADQDRAGGQASMVLEIQAPYRNVRRGESVAVAGACLTVERARPSAGRFVVRAVETTQDRTLFGSYRVGRRVNLERAVRAADRLGGHLVQGHVDGVADVERVETRGDTWIVDLRVPEPVRAVCIPQGSITVDGVSLTVNALPPSGVVQVSLIPFTRAHTTLGTVAPGDRLHVEGDLIGKYVRQLCRPT